MLLRPTGRTCTRSGAGSRDGGLVGDGAT